MFYIAKIPVAYDSCAKNNSHDKERGILYKVHKKQILKPVFWEIMNLELEKKKRKFPTSERFLTTETVVPQQNANLRSLHVIY